MLKSDFHYSLPPELIAQCPASPRTASRLLSLNANSGLLHDLRFTDVSGLLQAGDLLVFNDTRVMPARLFGHKDSGGHIEVLIERILGESRVLAQIRASKPPKSGQKLVLDGGVTADVRQHQGEFYELEFDGKLSARDILERFGHMPLPPYITRPDGQDDRERYQTVYARNYGAVAAPTAGLHFDQSILVQLKEQGIESAFVTLHVGAGTFQPVRVDDIREHRMHAEYISLPPSTCDRINAVKKAARRVVAVGTTVVRVLETAAQGGIVVPYTGETEIFIYPGYQFQIVDALLTNFHLPESTLLMLVCAFGGTQNVLNAYRHAVEQKYRFYSYGDAMFVER
ncbi:MAG: tRNA preQ1(34) S-adenosylmethionine ribosyltransferase-isomerase QueA [Sulfuricaulis sp.]